MGRCMGLLLAVLPRSGFIPLKKVFPIGTICVFPIGDTSISGICNA